MGHRIRLDSPGGQVSGTISGSGGIGILLAHGAGTNQDHPFMAGLREALARTGFLVMTFNYAYSERGSKRPDQTERLLSVHRAAADRMSGRVSSLFLAGRSMGGRMATYLAAEGYPAVGVVLYAYPLHPAGKEDRLRVTHLPEVKVPMLFFQGTRDPLSRMELFDRHIRALPNATVEVLEGADHSFRGGGWGPEAVIERLAGETAKWIERVSSGTAVDSPP